MSVALLVLLFYSIATLWIQERWALSVFQSGVFALAMVWAVRPRRVRWSLLLLPLGGAVLWGLLQLAGNRTVYRWDTWNAVLNWFTNFVLFFLALQWLTDSATRWRFLRAILYFGFGLSVVATLQMFTSGGKIFWLFPSGYADFVLGPFVSRNQYAAFMELILPLALVEALRDRRRAFMYVFMASVIFASVIAGASRAGSVMVVVETLAILLMAFLRGAVSGRTLALATGSFAVLAAVFSAVVGWELVWERFQQPDPYAGRREMLWSSMDMARAKPLWGFGLGTWPTAYPRYAYYDDGTFVNQAHNDWAQWAVEGGVPFFLMMLCVGIMALHPAVSTMWGIGVIAMLLHGVVDYPLQQRPALAGWFFVLLGALAAGRGGPAKTSTASTPSRHSS